MNHLSATATAQQKTELATSFKQLGDKFVNSLSKLQTAKSREFQFQAGDKLSIPAGFADVAYFVQKNADGSEERVPYAAFTATVARGTVKKNITISAGQLVNPSLLTSAIAEGTGVRRADMRIRFADAPLEIEDVDGVPLVKLTKEYKCEIAIGCYIPKRDSWVDGLGYTEAEHRPNYGYSK